MILEKEEYKIENNGIWISKDALEKWRTHYNKNAIELRNSPSLEERTDFSMFFVGKADVLGDMINFIETAYDQGKKE